ncbi:beta-galactosidase [Spirillospora sp. NPDC047279]|uniref:beta-galactosidase n=1 Tax=Spirillospora sp. NPDC047279 TaxID=3155478 RepID=UPI0034016E7F
MAALLVTATALWAPPSQATAGGTTSGTVAAGKQVTYDRHSLIVDGRRVVLWTGEFHYFRLPSQELWRDVLEKVKAGGFNGVSLYFHWGYHSPERGVYDFSGVRDIDRLLRMTEEYGLYVVARPGPYINAETTGGGLPAWLKTVPGRARSSDPGYTAAYREWLDRVNPIIARHQVTRGGSVIAYNAENEYAVNTDRAYMADISARARAAGIDVPITHNQCCDAADWTTDWSTGQGAVDILGVDDYPQAFNCRDPRTWGTWGTGITESRSREAPVYAAEYQAGAIDLNDAGYEGCRELTGPDFMKVYYKSNLIGSGATMFGYYMAYGGTSWGWLPQPNDVYTSYDYGAAITENRQLTTKYDEFKRQGLFVTTVAPLARTDPAAAPASSSTAVHTEARANPDTGTQFVLVRHADRTTDADESATLTWAAPDGSYTVPVRVKGRDARVLLAGYDLGGQRLAVTTSELLTHTVSGGTLSGGTLSGGSTSGGSTSGGSTSGGSTSGGTVSGRQDVAVLYGKEGTPGTTVLRYGSRPTVKVLSGSVRTSYENGNLTLGYTHRGLARVLVSGGGRRPALLLLGTDEEAAKFWRADGTLVRGTSLVRSAKEHGSTLHVRADVAAAGDVEAFTAARGLTVNGARVDARRTASGSLLGRAAGPVPVRLPELTGWRSADGAPEARPDFDDSHWTVADKTTTVSPIKPRTLPVLYSDEYGAHHGHVWYRGRFTAGGRETTVDLNAITGRKGIYQVWLNGRYLGSAAGGVQADAGDASTPPNPDPGPGHFTVPAGLLEAGEPAVLSVLVGNMGHNDDWTAEDVRQKQPRGLVGASIAGATSPLTWRIKGAPASDPERGPLNNGGLTGERGPRPASPATPGPGVTWRRTTFDLDLPKGHDVPLTLRLGKGSGTYRVLLFLNGWNVGQYPSTGPQQDFALPAGVLNEHGRNTLSLAVISETDAAPGAVTLVPVANHRGGAR